VLPEQITYGHTEPRLFTPPLQELTPETSWGFECIGFLEQVLGWELIPYQKWLYIHSLEKDLAAGLTEFSAWDQEQGQWIEYWDYPFRFNTIVIEIARQNGKTKWLLGLALWMLFVHGARQALITAQNLDYAEGTLAEGVAEVEEHPSLNGEKIAYHKTNGKHRLALTGKRLWRAATSNRRGGRSLSADLAELDELREHATWDAWNAIVPTTTARRHALVVAASNAGDAASVVLRTIRDNALALIETDRTEPTRTFIGEWSAPPEADYRDPQWYPYANPAEGYLIPEAKLIGFAETMTEAGFRTEHMCQWVDSLETGVIPEEDWRATRDPESRRAPQAPLYVGVDVNYQRSKAYIAVAARRADGLLHIEVIAGQAGTDWVIDWFAARQGRFEAIAAQERGAPVSELLDQLRDLGLPVQPWGGANLAKGCGGFYDLVTQHLLRHRPSPPLDAAARTIKARPIGDSWVFDRKNSENDAAPAMACAAAAWAESHPAPKPFRSAYEDDEPIMV
jgi:hypothetical protein